MIPRPVIIVPGLGGSIIVKPTQIYKKVFNQKMIDNRWLNLGILSVPYYSRRWKNDMNAIKYIKDENDNFIGIRDDYELDVYNMGGTLGIKNLLPEINTLPCHLSDKLDDVYCHTYFNTICNKLYQNGYSDHINLIGLPYNFKLILDPIVHLNYFNNIQNYVESMYNMHKEKIVVISHSFGGILFKWFLSLQSQEWIDKYIYRWISISTPFKGCASAASAVIRGGHYIPIMKNFFKTDLHVLSSLICCFPTSPEPFLELDNKLVLSYDKYEEYMDKHISLKIWNDLFKKHLEVINKKINVPTTIIISTSNNQTTRYIRKDGKEFITTGDGVVTEKSLLGFNDILHVDKVNIVNVIYANHTTILKAEKTLDEILSIVFQK